MTTPIAVPSVSDTAFWALPPTGRGDVWAELRRVAPVSHQQPTNLGLAPSGAGYWAVTSHADVQHVSRHPELFCSGRGVGLSDVPQEMLELNASFLVMDDPRHNDLRRVVSSAFTPRSVAKLEAAITEQAIQIVDQLVELGTGDVVQDLAMKLPLWTISELMGIPQEMRLELYRAAEGQMQSQDPEFATDGETAGELAVRSGRTLHRLAGELVAARRGEPTDDIFSAVVHAQLDGAPLSDALLGSIFLLFATAANDTTRNTTSHAMKAFADNPEQWSRLAETPALMGPAIEEMLRWATPVIHFRRTATEDTQIAGVPVGEGDAVVMFYESANRDEAVFVSPSQFDIGREKNAHVAFGGGGAHFCLGANLARTQLRAVFTRLSERVETIEVGEPRYLLSNFVNSVKSMPVSVVPR